MSTFAYLRDRLFLFSCVLYAVNRWAIKPLVPHGFFAWWLNDLLLIPCAVPVCLWIEKKTGLRKHDRPPEAREIVFVLLLWSVLFEIVAPRFIARATGDWLDAVAYAAGGALAWLWWNRPLPPRRGGGNRNGPSARAVDPGLRPSRTGRGS